MTIRKNDALGFLVVVAALLLGACANQMEPAQQAIAGIDSAISAASDAGKYVPDQLAAVQTRLADLKTAFDNKDYKTVLAAAPALLEEAQGLLGAAALKREDVIKAMTAEWPSLAATVPGIVAAVTNRATALSRSKNLPAGVDLPGAKTSVADAAAQWSKAEAASKAGDVEGSVTAAREAKAEAEAAAAAMKMKLPGAAPRA